MKQILITSALVTLTVVMAEAGITSLPSIKQYQQEAYYGGEFSLEGISIYVDPHSPEGDSDYPGMDGEAAEAGFGGGFAATYFPVEHFGLSTRVYWWDSPISITSVTGSAVFRYPIYGTGFAPYVFAGGGAHIDSDESLGSVHAGGGLEYRITSKIGIIGDYTYTWIDNAPDWGMFALGLRFVF